MQIKAVTVFPFAVIGTLRHSGGTTFLQRFIHRSGVICAARRFFKNENTKGSFRHSFGFLFVYPNRVDIIQVVFIYVFDFMAQCSLPPFRGKEAVEINIKGPVLIRCDAAFYMNGQGNKAYISITKLSQQSFLPSQCFDHTDRLLYLLLGGILGEFEKHTQLRPCFQFLQVVLQFGIGIICRAIL